MDITIEYNLDQTVVWREGYKVMDFLSDVGGVQSILMSLIGLFIGIVNYNMLDNFLIKRLYRIKTERPKKS